MVNKLNIVDFPPLTITNKQWYILFDSVYKIFVKKEIENRFYNSMSKIKQFTFSKCLIYKKDNVGLNQFIKNLYYLQDGALPKKEIKCIKRDIITKFNTNPKIINFLILKKKKTNFKVKPAI